MKSVRAALLLCCAAVCFSCDREYAGFGTFSDESWCREEPKEWVTVLPDSGRYEVSVCLRHTSDYGYNELNCAVFVRSNGGEWLQDTLCMRLTDDNGLWRGHGMILKSIKCPLTDRSVFFSAGEVRVRIEQVSDVRVLQGVHDIGLSFRKTK